FYKYRRRTDSLRRAQAAVLRAGRQWYDSCSPDRPKRSFSPSVRLLLLEDNVDAAASLAEALTLLDSNYEIRRVTKLREAEDIVQKERLEVALIDLTLPDADGCDAAIALRRVAPHLPLVALTGDRKSTRLNSSHVKISYAVFCLKKKKRGRWMVSA